MPPSPDAERSVYEAAKQGLRRWLDAAREKVLAPWRLFRSQPAPQAISTTAPLWQAEVDRILAALTPALREGWAAADLPGDYHPDDPYIRANLALTKNLLVRIPDEIHALVIRQILEGTSNQETVDQIADRVQNVLTYTGSEDWDGRARTIAQTESNRHFNGSMLAHGLLLQNQGRTGLSKLWDTRMDTRERPAHHQANNQTQPLNQPFIVGGEPLLFPVDPRGRPDNVINCIPPWELVSVRATGFMVRAFVGMLVNISTTGGNKLSATANHPVFTRRQGWVPISAVTPFDELLCCTEPWPRASSVHPDIANGESPAEDVARFLKLSVGTSERMSATFVDLDGNVVGEQVDVVRTNNVLSVGGHTAQLQQLRHLSVHGCHCKMCLAADVPSLLFLKEADDICFGCGSRTEALPLHNLKNTPSIKAKCTGHCLNRDPFLVHARNLYTKLVIETSSSLSSGPMVQSKFLQCLLDLPHADIEALRYLASRQTHFTKLTDALNILDSIGIPRTANWHRISSISHSHYDGVVYDFSTIDGIFTAGGVVVSNCRCELRILGGLTQ